MRVVHVVVRLERLLSTSFNPSKGLLGVVEACVPAGLSMLT